jgi:hypothetical protein
MEEGDSGMKGRSARLELSYENVDITADLLPHLIGWTYNDNLSGQADDISITLEDRDQLWSGDWMPEDGAKLTAKIVRENWNGDGATDELPLGEVTFDEIEVSSPPTTVTIKAQSVPDSSSLRGEEKSRAWEKTKLSVVAQDVARGAGLSLFYDTDDDPDYDRVEQAGETDLAYLQRLCTDAGLCLKVSDAQIVIFDDRKYEAQDAIATIKRGETELKNISGRKTLSGLYKSCRVEYRDASKGTTISYTFTPPSPPNTARVLVVNERVDSTARAEILAMKRLREKNREGTTYSLTLPGDIAYLAGLTVNLEGFGKFDGKYIITQATHAQNGSYETRLQLRKVLIGY